MKYINLDSYGRQKDSFYFALEKYLLTLDDDFCFLWTVYPAVIVGKHQIINQEINQKALEKLNIGLFRRPSGGGAVYSDEGCIKYTFISKRLSKDGLYFYSLTKIKDFLETLGLKAEFSGRNDLLINGYKFSGNAYYQTKDGKVLHGTILFDTDLEKMSQVLTPNQEKLSSKGVKSVKSRVTNLSNLIDLSRHEFIYLLEKYLNYNEKILTKEENKIISDYQQEFESFEYIYQDRLDYQYLKSKRFEFGEIVLNFNLDNNKIKKIKILGDFFEKKSIDELEKALINFNLKNVELPILIGDYIENMKNEEFLNLLKGSDNNE
ncbi:MAG: lipoate--protein ligase [Acholeplasmataceae bacterium]|jgi:lipoyltransferase/lipoate-protein ligase